MTKPSHQSFLLPHICALENLECLDKGRTTPYIIRGIDINTNQKGDYVVKYKGAPQLPPNGSCKELIASFIGLELDQPVPLPAIIEITSEFIESTRRTIAFPLVSASMGNNFGCTFHSGYSQLHWAQSASYVLTNKLLELFLFDIVISNADRRVEKPNFLINGEDLLMFDHEMAFGFLDELPFLRNPKPWKIRENEMNWLANHFCFNRFKGKPLAADSFLVKLTSLDSVFWDKVNTLLPVDWHCKQTGEIKGYIDQLIENEAGFANEIKRILS